MALWCLTKANELPLDIILADIKRALEAGLFYLAINVSLSLPDICSALECDLIANPQCKFKADRRYIPWCKKWLEPMFANFTAEDCWALRGSIIHQGQTFGHPKARYDRVLFTLPNGPWAGSHDNVADHIGGSTKAVLQLDAAHFCRSMAQATVNWYEASKHDPNVIANMPNLVQFRPYGYPPYFFGIPGIS